MRGSILVVDDNADEAEALAELLRAQGFRATAETDPVVALDSALDDSLDVVVSDLRMEHLDGLELCGRIAAARPDLPVVIVTGHVSVDAAVGALRAGAFDFVVKPIDPELLALTLQRAVAHHRLKGEVHRLREVVASSQAPGLDTKLGASPAMRHVIDVVGRIAPTHATVLVTGESGTGKELVARAIHERSSRASGPFVAINCAAVPATLLESELFGHVRGAFTDAKASRRGLFLEAQGGTLFLDEVGDMPLEMQVKLLRAIQERTVRAVGGSTEVPFDARVITATNRDLELDVAEKRFREDLYYRINVCSVHVPPLRERDGDVPLLAHAFVARFAAKHGKAVVGISAPALTKLSQYRWPGNVRELENSLERAVAMAQHDQLVVDDLPERIRHHRAEATDSIMPATVRELVSMEQLKLAYMTHVLELVHGNKSQAARILGFDRRTLYRKLEPRAQGSRGADAGEASAMLVRTPSTPPPQRPSVPPARPGAPRGPSTGAPSGPPPPAHASGTRPITWPPPAPPARTVLVVDDDEDSRVLMQEMLEASGYRVSTASGVAEAMQTREVDVVLTDLHLRDGSGTDLVGRFGTAPVVAMTGRIDDHRHDVGFVGWLTKPISPESLTMTLRSALHA